MIESGIGDCKVESGRSQEDAKEATLITNSESGTNVHEIAEGIYRINTPLSLVPGGFSFSQYLIADDEPLLFHTG